MNNDALTFATIFIVAVAVICTGVLVVALGRISAAPRVPAQGRRARSHRIFRDVL